MKYLLSRVPNNCSLLCAEEKTQPGERPWVGQDALHSGEGISETQCVGGCLPLIRIVTDISEAFP